MFKVELKIGYEKACFKFDEMKTAGEFIQTVLENNVESESEDVEVKIMMEAE